MRRRCFILAILGFVLLLASSASWALDMRGDTIYLVVPDRFFDGDPTNDTAVDPTLYSPDHSDWQKYWGGDVAGLHQKLDYLQAIGATTIWVTPMCQNAPVIGTYHGYQMQDLFRADPHFGSFSTLDSLTCDMHSRGIKLMLDISLNSGPATSAGNPNGSQCLLKRDGVVVARYLDDTDNWFHHDGDIDWNNFNYWDQVNQNIFGLADLNQDNPAVADYLKEGAALWQYHGVDCFRLDAAKHYEPTFGHDWMNSVNQVANWLGKPGTYAVAEWYGGGANNSDSLWWTSTAGTAQFDFQLSDILRGVTGEWNSMYDLWNVLSSRETGYGTDSTGSPSVNWQVDFFDSQDTQRLIIPLLQKYGTANLSEVQQRIAMALGLMEMLPGIPCVFYGEEQYLHNDTVNSQGVAGGDPYNRPQMTSFDPTTLAAQTLKKASGLRRISPAVQYGDIQQRWVDSSLLIFSRQAAGAAVLVGVNNSWLSRTETVQGVPFPDGTYSDVLGFTSAVNVSGGTAQVTVPARTAVVFSYLPSPLPTGPIPDSRCSLVPPNLSGPPPSGAVTIDGANIPADFSGHLRATQTDPTMFGDSNGSGPGSELDQLFATNDGSNLYLGITGNLEQNGNFLLVFLDTGSGGAGTLSATAGPGVVASVSGAKMDDGFTPRWLLAINAPPGGVFYADLVDLANNTNRFLGAGSVNSGSGVLSGGTAPGGEMIAFNDTNSAGVTSSSVVNANTAMTGFEIKLPFRSIGLLSNQVKVMAAVTGATGFFSNQCLPPMGGIVAGSVGGYQNLGFGPVDFGKIAGTQYATVALQGIAYQQLTSAAQAKLQPDGTAVSLPAEVGIGSFPWLSSFYVEDPNNLAGIRVMPGSNPMADIGQAVGLDGFMSSQGGERVLLATDVNLGGPAAMPKAVGMSNCAVGGGAAQGSLGVDGGVGLSNIGLNVFTWGGVTSTGADTQGNAFFYVDDGSHLTDGAVVGGAPAVGVRVYSSLVFPSVNQFVRVQGVSGVEMISGKPERRILTRQPSDVMIIH